MNVPRKMPLSCGKDRKSIKKLPIRERNSSCIIVFMKGRKSGVRNYDENQEVKEVFCNKCKKSLIVENGIIKEGCFSGNMVWGYFSTMDGRRHSFDLCEACYRQMIQTFAISVTETDETEFV